MNWTTISSSTPVARREYDCEWCDIPIVKGLRHAQWTGLWHGDPPQSVRMHGECVLASIRESGEYDEEEICIGPHGRGLACGEGER